MRVKDLWENYPVLYHIAWGGSWANIQKQGLLSTKELLKLYEQDEKLVERLTRQRRSHWVTIRRVGLPNSVLRDQKPMTDQGVRRALDGKVEPWQWYDLINSMVFFWPTKDRLRTMISASAYEEVCHDVLVVDTRKLVEIECVNLRLSSINSGCTKPYPHPRDLGLFKSIFDYPFDCRRRKYGKEKAVAEVCVLDRVHQISDVVLDVKSGNSRQIRSAFGLAGG